MHNACNVTENIQGHHSDPEFMGGDPNQKLTMMGAGDHAALHADLNDFLEAATWMTLVFQCDHPQKNSAEDIQSNFPLHERQAAMADFLFRNMARSIQKPRLDFFKQHQSK